MFPAGDGIVYDCDLSKRISSSDYDIRNVPTGTEVIWANYVWARPDENATRNGVSAITGSGLCFINCFQVADANPTISLSWTRTNPVKASARPIKGRRDGLIERPTHPSRKGSFGNGPRPLIVVCRGCSRSRRPCIKQHTNRTHVGNHSVTVCPFNGRLIGGGKCYLSRDGGTAVTRCGFWTIQVSL